MKGKEIAKKFNEKSFICNETGHQAKNYRNRAQQRNPKQKKGLLKSKSPRSITL